MKTDHECYSERKKVMGSKHLTDEQIALFAEAMSTDSSEKLSLEWRSHVSNCDECAQMVLMVSDTIKDMKLSDNVIPIDRKNSKRDNRWVVVAASVIILLSVGFYFTTFLSDASREKVIVQTDTIPIFPNELNAIQPVIEKVSLADKPEVKKVDRPIKELPKVQLIEDNKSDMLAYVPHEQLEKLSDRFSSSAAMRGDDILVISENTIEGLADKMKIEWQNEAEQLLIIEFFNNKGDKLFEEETTASYYNLNKLNQPGLYYWKLINEDFDLLFCGRIKTK